MNLKFSLPPLRAGDRLTQADFHRRYQACPEKLKAELIGGIVYMASPLRRPHGKSHIHLGTVFGLYEAATPGVEALDNATTILGPYQEPQPDLALRLLPEFGGRSRENKEHYIVGAAELLGEIADSTKAIDLHQKRRDYEKAAVQEYLVLCLKERKLIWFHFPSGGEIKPTPQGVFRSRVFPGLWVNGPALLTGDSARVIHTANRGLAHPEHKAFVKRLAQARLKVKKHD